MTLVHCAAAINW